MQSELPKVVWVRRKYECPELGGDIGDVVDDQVKRVFEGHAVPRGARIGICAGSRGIYNLKQITKSAVDSVRSLGYEPVILPAMGSHGGATAEGQREMLADPGIGITEASMGCEMDARMDTRIVDETHGFPIYWAQSALDCDFVFLINRIKIHTEIFGEPSAADIGMPLQGSVHSGLLKMLAVGLGKQKGAEVCHRQIPTRLGLGGAVTLGARVLVESSAKRGKGKVLGGLAIVENSFDQTALVEGIPFDSGNPLPAFERERELLDYANSMMPSLPAKDLDVLWIGQMGKRISGTGMDTNVLNRNPYGYHPGERWRPQGPSVSKVVCSSLQSSSHGNAHGVGLADFITKRLAVDIDHDVTRLNSLTAFSPLLCSLPPVMRNDREAILAAINTSAAVNGARPAFAAIPDTLHPGDALVSELVREKLDPAEFEFPNGDAARDLAFDPGGYLIWPE
ncbi:hypothetical protein [Pelagicoccus mobilis]|uniref:LarA-like N-terminal domain-containing protein n=1 Tax=Pelagicoccus mobilis TaxID=415221 RepID=A0A934S6I6_9BACT|nr:hypothetical protein [Pelagicoccus mobilis]MBK1879843.1 hypothetical protein [Pelagicoccus mobilis]